VRLHAGDCFFRDRAVSEGDEDLVQDDVVQHIVPGSAQAFRELGGMPTKSAPEITSQHPT
jgi:hypothetical protein